MPRKTILSLFSIALMTAMVLAPNAQAQQDGNQQGGQQGGRGGRGGRGGQFNGFNRGGGGGSMLFLLRVDAVDKEIKLTEDQKELVQILNDELREGRPDFPQNFRDLSDEEQAAAREKMEKANAEQTAQAKETLKTILDEGQYKRLQEISIQTQGVNALLDPDVTQALKITPEQTAKLKETQEANRQEMFAMFRDRSGDREARQEKFDQLRKDSETKMLATLTEEQKTAFEAMKGKPFEMPDFRRGGGGGRPQGGGGNAGGNRPQRPE